MAWPILDKLRSFTSTHFSPEETYDYIIQLIIEVEDLLLNHTLSKAYTEEFGKYKGISRIVKKFRIYFKLVDHHIIIVALLFPGEN